MVGKLVGQYSDSGRVSHLRQHLPKGTRRSGVPRVQKESEKEELPTSSGEGRRLAQHRWAIVETRLSSWGPLQRQVQSKRGGGNLSHRWEPIEISSAATLVYILSIRYLYWNTQYIYFRLTPFVREYNTRLTLWSLFLRLFLYAHRYNTVYNRMFIYVLVFHFLVLIFHFMFFLVNMELWTKMLLEGER